jgi:hypothetical protein
MIQMTVREDDKVQIQQIDRELACIENERIRVPDIEQDALSVSFISPAFYADADTESKLVQIIRTSSGSDRSRRISTNGPRGPKR